MEAIEKLLEALQELNEDHFRQCTKLSKVESEVDRVRRMILCARNGRWDCSQKSDSGLVPDERSEGSGTHNTQRCEVPSGSHTPLPSPAPAPPSSPPVPAPSLPSSPTALPPPPPPPAPAAPAAPPPSPPSSPQASEQAEELVRKLIENWDNISAFMKGDLDGSTRQNFPEVEDPLLQDATLQRPKTTASILRQQFARPVGYLEYLHWREAQPRKKSTKTGPFIRERGYQNFDSAVQMLSDGKKMLTIIGLYTTPTTSLDI